MCKNIYLIDDDQQFQYLFATYFGDFANEANITTYNRAETVLEHLIIYKEDPRKLPDIIVVDLSLPSMNGIDFVERMEGLIKELAKTPELYIITVNQDPETMMILKTNPLVRAFFNKPINSDICEHILGLKNGAYA